MTFVLFTYARGVGVIVFDIFKRLTEEYNQTLLIVTHDQSFAERTQRTIKMEDGKIISQ